MDIEPPARIQVAENLQHGTLVATLKDSRIGIVWDFAPLKGGDSPIRDAKRIVFLDKFDSCSLMHVKHLSTYIITFDGNLHFSLDTNVISEISQAEPGDIVFSIQIEKEPLMRLQYPSYNEELIGVPISGKGLSAILHQDYCGIVKKWSLYLGEGDNRRLIWKHPAT